MARPFPVILLSALILAACSRSPSTADEKPVDPVAVAVRDAHAEFFRLQAQDKEKTAREITQLEYPAYRELMKASGLDDALGGETQADAALRELFAGYEHRMRSLEYDLPKMMPMAYTGIEIGYSGLATSMLAGGLQNTAAVSLWEHAQDEGKPSGNHSQSGNGSGLDMQWSETSTSTTSTFEGKLPGGLQGKVTTKVEVDTCPDASGKVNASFTSNSELRSTTSAGTGGFIKVTAKLTKQVDDDANLIDGQMDSEVHVEQTTFDNYNSTFVDVTTTLSTTRDEMGTQVNGRSQTATDASVKAAEGLAKMGEMAAIQAINGAKSGWESGKCVTLQPTSSPAKRKGAQPSTRFQITAAPRAKSDGAPTGGSIRATLSGGASLEPAGKVPADATYSYAAPDEKNQSASIAFESRSKRGVGKATLEFDTKSVRAFTMQGGGGQFSASGKICDLSQSFSISGSGVKMTFSPSSEQGGSYTYSGNMSGFGVSGSGTYTASVNENGGSITGSGPGCVQTPMGTKCAGGTEKYTLAPAEPCE